MTWSVGLVFYVVDSRAWGRGWSVYSYRPPTPHPHPTWSGRGRPPIDHVVYDWSERLYSRHLFPLTTTLAIANSPSRVSMSTSRSHRSLDIAVRRRISRMVAGPADIAALMVCIPSASLADRFSSWRVLAPLSRVGSIEQSGSQRGKAQRSGNGATGANERTIPSSTTAPSSSCGRSTI
jgi:hypothetical protein